MPRVIGNACRTAEELSRESALDASKRTDQLAADLRGNAGHRPDMLVDGQAHDALSVETLAWLKGALKKAGDSPVLIVMHHPPFNTGIGHMDRQGLTNADVLFDILARYGGEIALPCGHVHRMIATVRDGRPIFIAPSPSHAMALEHRSNGPAELMLEPGGFLFHRCPSGGKGCCIVTEQVPIGLYPGPYPSFSD